MSNNLIDRIAKLDALKEVSPPMQVGHVADACKQLGIPDEHLFEVVDKLLTVVQEDKHLGDATTQARIDALSPSDALDHFTYAQVVSVFAMEMAVQTAIAGMVNVSNSGYLMVQKARDAAASLSPRVFEKMGRMDS